MILMYHKVSLLNESMWWVSVDEFNRQMCELSEFDVVYLDDYNPRNPKHAVITFDGVYENIFNYALPILKKWGYPFELFVTGKYIGKSNNFDKIEPSANFCNMEQLQKLAKSGGRVQWHTHSHKTLENLSKNSLSKELDVPMHMKSVFSSPNLEWFAYPHGIHDTLVEKEVKKRFKGALSCVNGNHKNKYKYNRMTVLENTTFSSKKISAIIANYNYGRFIHEAFNSLINQTVKADEIIIIDDASSDDSEEQINLIKSKVDHVIFNKNNLGIIKTFNKAVNVAKGDLIFFLGADNILKADYIEKCKSTLLADDNIALAYTDLVLFGPSADDLAKKVNAEYIGRSYFEGWNNFLWNFPEFTKNLLNKMKYENFAHGSSMYRKKLWHDVGGYQESNNAEDHNLFYRMLKKMPLAKKATGASLYYRQHSASQANTFLSFQNTIYLYKSNLNNTYQDLVSLQQQAVSMQQQEVSMQKKIVNLENKLKSKKWLFFHLAKLVYMRYLFWLPKVIGIFLKKIYARLSK